MPSKCGIPGWTVEPASRSSGPSAGVGDVAVTSVESTGTASAFKIDEEKSLMIQGGDSSVNDDVTKNCAIPRYLENE